MALKRVHRESTDLIVAKKALSLRCPEPWRRHNGPQRILQRPNLQAVRTQDGAGLPHAERAAQTTKKVDNGADLCSIPSIAFKLPPTVVGGWNVDPDNGLATQSFWFIEQMGDPFQRQAAIGITRAAAETSIIEGRRNKTANVWVHPMLFRQHRDEPATGLYSAVRNSSRKK